jgi:hypothetical protein
MIIDDIRELVRSPDFKPFSIETNDGRSIKVPSRDHVAVTRNIVIIEHDDGTSNILYTRNISGVTVRFTHIPP